MFGCLKAPDALCVCRLVSSKWSRVRAQVEELELTTRKCHAVLRCVLPLQVRRLSLDPDPGCACESVVAQVPHVHTLTMCLDREFADLETCRRLACVRTLDLSESWSVDLGFWISVGWPLDKFVLRNCCLRKEQVPLLGLFTTLTWLDVGSNPQLDDQALEILSTLSRLRSLNISRLREITDAGIATLAALPVLSTLDVSRTCIRGSTLGALANLTNLDASLCQKINGASLRLPPRVEVLNLNCCRCLDHQTSFVPSITGLSVFWCHGLDLLALRARLPALKVLHADTTHSHELSLRAAFQGVEVHVHVFRLKT